MFQLFFYQRHAPLRRDISLEGNATFDSWNWIQIDTDFDGCDWHILSAYLQPNILKLMLKHS